jgi:hypothetical protein
VRERNDDLQGDLRALARLDEVVPLLAGRIRQHVGLPRKEIRKEAHVVRVVGHDEEVERSRQLHRLTARRLHLLAAREAIRIAR